ncbi:MAG: polysaccharide deacetylase family protein [Candidatus Zixiibacteriota bacterium]
MDSPDNEGQRGSTAIVAGVLAFHKLLDRFSYGATNYSPRRMARLLEVLVSSGYHFESLNVVMQRLSLRTLAVTFDDGYRHLAEELPPLIDQFGIVPHVFVPTALIGCTNDWDYSHRLCSTSHLSVNEIKQLARLGVTFGSHANRHCDLTVCSDAELREELSTSKRLLEEIISAEVTTISYPFGRVNQRVLDTAVDIGYQYGFTMRFPRPDDKSAACGRWPVYGFDTPFSVTQKIGNGPLFMLEQLKSQIATGLSGGTLVLGKLTRWFG